MRAFVSPPARPCASWRAERKAAFAHEATQYALWIQFAALARACAAHAVALLYVVRARGVDVALHARGVGKFCARSRWWRPPGAIARREVAAAGGHRRRATFGRFFVDYVFWGAIAMACVCFRWCRNRSVRDVPGYGVFVGVRFRGKRGAAAAEAAGGWR